MASCASIHGSPVGAFKHDLRERDTYKNEDIDSSRSHLNYSLSTHGNTSRECMKYYDSLLENCYHRAGSTVTSAEWSIQIPPDLEHGREAEFLKCTFDFLNHYHFNGDDSRCLLAVVHRDEAGEDHLHYVYTFPEKDNSKYVEMEKKFVAGMKSAIEKYEFTPSKKQLQDCFSALERYENRTDKHRERDTIQEIGRLFDLKRDDARWIFTRVRRLESERYEKRLMSKDEFLTRDFFNNFHPSYQKWIYDHGFDCTVYRGGGGINLTVDQLKEITKQTGITLEKGLNIEYLSSLIKDSSRLKELEKQVEKSHEHGWGNASGWGRNRDKSREIDHEWNR